jgi:hypothetical protein
MPAQTGHTTGSGETCHGGSPIPSDCLTTLPERRLSPLKLAITNASEGHLPGSSGN